MEGKEFEFNSSIFALAMSKDTNNAAPTQNLVIRDLVISTARAIIRSKRESIKINFSYDDEEFFIIPHLYRVVFVWKKERINERHWQQCYNPLSLMEMIKLQDQSSTMMMNFNYC